MLEPPKEYLLRYPPLTQRVFFTIDKKILPQRNNLKMDNFISKLMRLADVTARARDKAPQTCRHGCRFH